jgi:serine/threonine protein kinase
MEDKDIKNFYNEVSIMLKLHNVDYDNFSHPNILKFEHYFDEQKRFMLVMELCEGGELFKLMQDKKLVNQHL